MVVAKPKRISHGKILGWTAFAGLALVLLSALCWSVLDRILIATTEISRYPNDALGLDALIISKDAGATSDTAYHVVLRDKRALFPQESTAFVADHVYRPSNLKVRWRGNKLVVTYPASARIFRQSLKVEHGGSAIAVEYVVD